MSDDKPVSSITSEEEILVGETPAVLSNKFYVTSTPYGTKITFAEGFFVGGGHQLRSRCAVHLSPDNIRALYQLLEPIVRSMRTVPASEGKSTQDG